MTEGAAPPPISFTTPTGSPTTLVFAAEGVFVGDDPLIVTVHNNSSKTQIITAVTITPVGDPTDFLLNRNNCGYVTSHANCSLGRSVPADRCGCTNGGYRYLRFELGHCRNECATQAGGNRGVGKRDGCERQHQEQRAAFPCPGSRVAKRLPVRDALEHNRRSSLHRVLSAPLAVRQLISTPVTAPIVTDCPTIVSVGQSCTFGVCCSIRPARAFGRPISSSTTTRSAPRHNCKCWVLAYTRRPRSPSTEIHPSRARSRTTSVRREKAEPKRR